MYNLTNLTSAENIGDLVYFGNEVTSGIMMGLIVMGVAIVLLVSMKKESLADGLEVVGFIMFLASGVLTFAGLLGIIFPVFFLIVTGLAALFNRATS